jgi:DNA-binding NtrC family response regulator
LERNADSSRNRLLVVDDEPELVDMLSKGLSYYGFEVDAFDDPQVVLSRFKPNYYDMSILDIRMPGMNGFQLYRKLREIDPKLPVCFMTAFAVYREEYEKVFPQHDIRAFVEKPVTLARLNNIVREAIEQKGGYG